MRERKERTDKGRRRKHPGERILSTLYMWITREKLSPEQALGEMVASGEAKAEDLPASGTLIRWMRQDGITPRRKFRKVNGWVRKP